MSKSSIPDGTYTITKWNRPIGIAPTPQGPSGEAIVLGQATHWGVRKGPGESEGYIISDEEKVVVNLNGGIAILPFEQAREGRLPFLWEIWRSEPMKYSIVSVQKGEAGEMLAWRVSGRAPGDSVQLEVLEGAAAQNQVFRIDEVRA
ncbi:hypothetical protein D9611_013424 [Ephemerocybe angulata]|uniref:Uncharacterized protein n=1 Tax=Ephemerocybe angulata TaxID=980116 RepID=A0A8H5BV82_9AGAR|nr:hypothetical protein D9611_013424 [Tulosesus angulatus]